ncbi:hypothetical protein SETIT_8G028300v2 [Setaria italica]|uniref:RING-type domain-containing protein n=1 Tax=Setaria italica TaxID=4555 RepID=K3ZL44_SETIT|nr:E3 ubiquitin-protein ligase RNF181 [Setaria italica]RCV37014.1 hypothetical protein SETIT_8G028300v2 [Setaria italica]
MELDHTSRPLVVFGAPRHMAVRQARRSYRRAHAHDIDELDSEAQAPRYVFFREHDDAPSRAAASSEAILVLKEVTAGDAPQSECAVCLNDFHAEETLRAMPCSHAFHLKCIFTWLLRNGACPLCRHQLPKEEEQQEEESVHQHLTMLVLDD